MLPTTFIGRSHIKITNVADTQISAQKKINYKPDAWKLAFPVVLDIKIPILMLKTQIFYPYNLINN
ncbi:hypothetical protein KHD59_000755 [Sesame phyllody phytoplasma]|uniref:Uncharacterized protein n=1 Tax=Sesame phyllody phytoplasma TaxID=420408 RepID=A0ABS9M3Z0_9MOLU|nr:hypothetical protein [Sesame phyllody phytoplasma]MCG3566633.1 hypothetical protein [Sesame phyllody phytoplasma]